MSKIKNIISREIIDSRGFPTIETEVHLVSGDIGISSIPSGSSKGSKESFELRDNDNNRFFGKGVLKAINNIKNKILPNLIGLDSGDQFNIDKIMIDLDGTNNKSNLGANSILSVSLANAKAYSLYKKIKLYEYIAELCNNYDYIIPIPMINIINGGRHANNNLDIQEFMIQPISDSFKNSIRIASEIFYNLGKILKKMNLSTSVGDEGGYAPNIGKSEDALNLISDSINDSGYELGKDVLLSIDCASSEFYDYKTKKYNLLGENKSFNIFEFTNYLKNLSNKYNILSIEDGVHENDWEGCKIQTNILGKNIQLVGDDLFVTNFDILEYGIKNNLYNSILIKPNQVGTLTETIKTINLAKKYGYSTIISHRSGETEDNFISDLSIGSSSGQIKSGSVNRSERLSKYNQLIRIEESLINKKMFKFKYKKY